MKLIESLKQRWKAYKHQRYLKKMGWTEELFQRRTDPRVIYQAQTLNGFYSGYKHLHIYDDSRSGPFNGRNWPEVYQEMNVWCRANITGAWRDDIHRCYEQTGIGANGELSKEFWLHDIGNVDLLVYAFENERDYFMFALRWA
jgi:hypothetical protein